ncbi:hypothetical protein [Burkholderia sp. SCN-KJ]|uniref:hypothetical protein n=1 Tax=Burkholderia sp. SCN-KJ TaxID=2969248 RepID=UPI0021505A60|nr:hypothetical protein [Burkholderia sp. SCN-KJ]MCR4468133.1 hypothetical protein [Burkholderia sp. SCN-KJ]
MRDATGAGAAAAMARHAARAATADVTAAPDDLGSSGAATGETRAQNTACPLLGLASQMEKNGSSGRLDVGAVVVTRT